MEQTIIKNIITHLNSNLDKLDYVFSRLGWLVYYDLPEPICIQRTLQGDRMVSFGNEIFYPTFETEDLIDELITKSRHNLQSKQSRKLEDILEQTNKLIEVF